MSTFITPEELKAVVNDKQSLHEAALRNNLFMPDLKDAFLTMQLLRDVKD